MGFRVNQPEGLKLPAEAWYPERSLMLAYFAKLGRLDAFVRLPQVYPPVFVRVVLNGVDDINWVSRRLNDSARPLVYCL